MAAVATEFERATPSLAVERVAAAMDALEELAADDRIACVVSADDLAETDGITFLRRVRERDDRLPFVLCPAAGDSERAAEALATGATDYVARSEAGAVPRIVNTVERALGAVADRTDARRELHTIEDALRRFHRIVADTDRSLDDRIRSLLAVGCDRLGLSRGLLMRTTENRLHVEYTAGTGDAVAVEPGTSFPLSETYCRRTVETDGLLAVRDAASEGWTEDPAYQRFGLGCYLGGTVTVDGDQYGTLCFVDEDGRDRSFTDSERVFVELLVQWVSAELERRRDERHLERQRDLFERTQRLADIGAWEYDVATDDLRWTEGVRRIHGLPSGHTVTAGDALDFYHDEDRPRIEAAIERAISDAESYEFEARLVTPSGETRWVLTRGEPQVEDGSVVRIRGTIRDITHRKERERRLREQGESIAAIAEHIPVALFTLDGDGRFTRSHGSVLDHAGLGPDEVVGESVFDLFADHDAIVEGSKRALEGESGQATVEVGGRTLDVWYHPLTEAGSVERVVGLALDVTERERRLRELETYERMLNVAGDGIYHLDETGRFVTVNDATTAMTGYDRAELLGEPVSLVMDDDDIGTAEALIADLVEDEERSTDGFEMAVQPKDGESVPVENRITVLQGEDGSFEGSVGVVRDITERKEHAETLAALHEVTSDLLRSESPGAIGEEVVRVAEDVLDFDAIGVFRFDGDENSLHPVAYSERTVELVGEPPRFGPGDGIAWEVFVEGEARYYEDVREAENVYDPATPIRTELLLPLGDYGVLITGSETVREVDDRTIELVQILAANCEAAIARTEREQALRERDRELQSRNERLERLDEINETIRAIDRALVDARTREEIEQAVCDRLTSFDRFAFAWIGDVDPAEGIVEPAAWAGTEHGYLDAVDPRLGGTEPAVEAVESRARVTVDSVADRLHDEAWAKEALSRDFLSATAVPLVHDGVLYGVLTVYADRAGAVDERSDDVLAELGGTIASALNAAERRRALVADTVTELEFHLPAPDTTLFGIAEAVDGTLQVDSVLAQPDGASLAYLTVPTDTSEDAVDRMADYVSADRVRELGSGESGDRFEVRFTGETVAATVAELGGRVRELAFDGDRETVTVSLPETANARRFIDRFTERYADAEFVARRQRAIDSSAGNGIDAPLDGLTAKQTEALRIAYHSGFFEWPRESTGEELADSLGVSPPTFLEHLRRAEGKLVADLFADGYRPVSADD